MSTRWCANCGYSLDADAARCPQCGHAEAVAPVTAGSLPGPHRAALPVMAILTAVFTPAPLLLLWIRAANDAPDWLWPVAVAGTALCATFLLLGLLIAWLDRRQRQRSAAFLNSDRLLLRWTYEPQEWLAIRKLAWQEQAGDWQV
ncbi:MAG: zinc ribbon domain-containing protein, partial [Anaerolineales bacterium]|nr:zinc ribbon domain-containing protein [Anaerolineales bacterium]